MLHRLIVAGVLFQSLGAYGGEAPKDTCGISLSPSAMTLLRDVERRCGRPVRCQTVSNMQNAEGGIALEKVASGGTPTVTLDIFSGKTETSFVHELFHLQLRARGFPQDFSFHLPPGVHRARPQGAHW
jgi:hypothetical protein